MTTQPMLSTPALILSIGTSMLPAMAEVERIFLQSDARRGRTTHFLSCNLSPRKNEAGWIPLEQVLTPKSTPSSWKDAFDLAQKWIEPLKAGIRSSLHDLRSHEKLIEVGLGGKNALPLDVYMIADLSEPDASAVLTLLPTVQSLLMDEPYAAFHVLLNIVAFDEDPVSNANVHASLNNIRTLLRSQNEFPIPQIYLFDRFKEGTWEAQDALEVQTILGNFLLALLSGGLAQNIAHQLPQTDIEQYDAYFCGASATVITLDTEQLQKACALRLGHEILDNEFHSRVNPNPALIEGVAINFLSEHANTDLWRLRLCQDTLFHASTGWKRFELHIHDLQFEGLPIDQWAQTIQEYDETFRVRQLPVQFEVVGKNSIELDKGFRQQILIFAESLPQQVNLYPGGVQASRRILEQIRDTLPTFSKEFAGESAVDEQWNVPIKTSLEWLESAIAKLRKPPNWVLHLPGFLRGPAVQLFNLIYLHRDLQMITELREASLRLLEKKYAALMESKVDQVLVELHWGWVDALDKQIRSVKRLQAMVDRLQVSIGMESIQMSSASTLFRFPVLDDTLFAWAYYQGKRPQAGFRHSLLTDAGFFRDWQALKSKTLEEHLLDFCREAYRNISSMDLDEALSHRNGKDNSDLAVALSHGAIPLLRPNFDQTGSGPSYQMRFFQSRDPHQSSLLPIIKSDKQDLQEISTGDPSLAICCRVRVMLPFASISHIFERGREGYDALNDETKKQYFLMEGK